MPTPMDIYSDNAKKIQSVTFDDAPHDIQDPNPQLKPFGWREWLNKLL
jgi:hypothetical protein